MTHRRLVALLVLLTGVTLTCAPNAARAQTPGEAARLFEALELRPGATIGEIGAGNGDLTLEMARRVGPTGRVYSTELDPARLAAIRAAVSRDQLTNVTVVEAGERSTNLPNACCDAIFLRDVYHHFSNPREIARSLFAALKPGGRLAVIDFEPPSASPAPGGVPAGREGHGIRPDAIAGEVTSAGLLQVGTVMDWLEDRPRQNRRLFLVLFRKPQP